MGKLQQNFEIKKILTDSRKLMETLLRKSEVIRNWWRYYEEILESFSKVISMKSKTLRRNLIKIEKI